MGSDCRSLYRSPVCQTLSNARDISRKAAEQYCLVLIAS
jgi:hypothetical protein